MTDPLPFNSEVIVLPEGIDASAADGDMIVAGRVCNEADGCDLLVPDGDPIDTAGTLCAIATGCTLTVESGAQTEVNTECDEFDGCNLIEGPISLVTETKTDYIVVADPPVGADRGQRAYS